MSRSDIDGDKAHQSSDFFPATSLAIGGPKKTVLLVEDDPGQRGDGRDRFNKAGWNVYAYPDATSVKQARSQWQQEVQWAVVDWDLSEAGAGGINGAELCRWLKEEFGAAIRTVLFTAHGESEARRDSATTLADITELKGTDQWIRLIPQLDALHANAHRSVGADGETTVWVSGPMRLIEGAIREFIGPSMDPVLIIGDTGLGKELTAKKVHECSGIARANNYRDVNCATFTDTLVMTELFGYVYGAFTQADRHSLGLILEAIGLHEGWKPRNGKDMGDTSKSYVEWLRDYNQHVLIEDEGGCYTFRNKTTKEELVGTLFLDEVGELIPIAQSAMLRLLDGNGMKPVRYVGPAFRPCIRVVAATNRMEVLDRGIDKGKAKGPGGVDGTPIFRTDLLWRLNGWGIDLPPMTQRLEDAMKAAADWISEFSGKGRNLSGMATDAVNELRAMVKRGDFSDRQGPMRSGNFRHLKWLIRRACWLTLQFDPKATVVSLKALESAARFVTWESLQSASQPDADHSSSGVPERDEKSVNQSAKLLLEGCQELARRTHHHPADFQTKDDIELDAGVVNSLAVYLQQACKSSCEVNHKLLFNNPGAALGDAAASLPTHALARWRYLFILGCIKAAISASESSRESVGWGALSQAFGKDPKNRLKDAFTKRLEKRNQSGYFIQALIPFGIEPAFLVKNRQNGLTVLLSLFDRGMVQSESFEELQAKKDAGEDVADALVNAPDYQQSNERVAKFLEHVATVCRNVGLLPG